MVTAADTVPADVLIEGETILAVGRGLGPADRTIDAAGRYVFPGGVDEHTHFGLPVSGTISQPWETESVAAALGGTTTVVDFAMQSRGGSLLEGIRTWQEKAAGASAIDYGFHVTVTDLHPAAVDEIPRVVAAGVTTLKCLMAYKGSVMVDDDTLFRALQEGSRHGALVMVHCENGDVVAALQAQLAAAGKTEPRYHAESRPPAVEAEATNRAIALAELAGASLLIVHVTSAPALAHIRAAQTRGLPIYAETCPQYVTLTVDDLTRPDFAGARYVLSPALRPAAHHEALWSGLSSGSLQTVGSDHCAFTLEQKALGRDDFRLIPNGIPAAEERLPLLYSEGPARGRLSLNRFVDAIATAPARLMGLYPRKGTIAPGSDADIVLFDPERRWTMGRTTQHSGSDYSPFEGWNVQGAVETVLLRGEIIVRGGRYVGRLGQGQYVTRRPFPG